jgi:hypothetical protein
MTSSRGILPRIGAALALALAAAAACTDATAPVGPEPTPPVGGPSTAEPIQLAVLDCTASVADRSVRCAPPEPSAGGPRTDIIYGGQNEFVQVTSSSVDYDAGTQKFTFQTRVRNLIGQPIGTTDGVTAAAGGVKLFFHSAPVATGGTGIITIDNADGVGTFTASGQPYYAYVAKIDPFAQSSAKLWQFDIPPTVTTFAFTMYVSSPVQYPTGWIETSHPTWNLRRTYEKVVTGVVYDQFGRVIPGATITWSSADGSLASATQAGNDAVVLGLLPGTVSIQATSTNDVFGSAGAVQNGVAQFNIAGTALVWTSGAGSTDWNAPGNWDRNVNPTAQDSVTIPVVGSGLYPQLVENEQIRNVSIAQLASINIGAFDLTASENVTASATGFAGGITGTVGRVFFTGTGKTASGNFPRMRVTGRYSMNGNITATAPLRVESGRVLNYGFRLRIVSQ